jgi:hypothetical protein
MLRSTSTQAIVQIVILKPTGGTSRLCQHKPLACSCDGCVTVDPDGQNANIQLFAIQIEVVPSQLGYDRRVNWFHAWGVK